MDTHTTTGDPRGLDVFHQPTKTVTPSCGEEVEGAEKSQKKWKSAGVHSIPWELYHFHNNDRIHDNQPGLRENHSFHTALRQVVDSLLSNKNQSDFAGILFVAFTKAFDVIDHSLLLRKLEMYRLPPDLFPLHHGSCLKKKHDQIANDSTSELLPVKFGVP